MLNHSPGMWNKWQPKTFLKDEEPTWSVSGPPSDFMFLRNEADADLIAAAPWLYLLSLAFARNWKLTPTILYDAEGVGGWILTDTHDHDYCWVGELWEPDQQTFDKVAAAMR